MQKCARKAVFMFVAYLGATNKAFMLENGYTSSRQQGATYALIKSRFSGQLMGFKTNIHSPCSSLLVSTSC